MLQEYNLTEKLSEVNLNKAWADIVGPSIARHTKEIQLRNQVLTIKLDSSVLREELSYGKEKLIKLMNDYTGKPIVKEIILY